MIKSKLRGCDNYNIMEVNINKYIWPYYDHGLLLKILDFYLEHNLYDKEKIVSEKLNVLCHTMMISSIKGAHKLLYGNENLPSCTSGFTI